MTIKEQIAKLIDVKSIITILLVICLVIVIMSGMQIQDNAFVLYSNVTTMVITYFFTKKSSDKDGETTNFAEAPITFNSDLIG